MVVMDLGSGSGNKAGSNLSTPVAVGVVSRSARGIGNVWELDMVK